MTEFRGISIRRGDPCQICRALNPTDNHRCPQSTFRGIDAADTRAWNAMDSHPLSRPTYSDRLRDGFKLLADEVRH